MSIDTTSIAGYTIYRDEDIGSSAVEPLPPSLVHPLGTFTFCSPSWMFSFLYLCQITHPPLC